MSQVLFAVFSAFVATSVPAKAADAKVLVVVLGGRMSCGVVIDANNSYMKPYLAAQTDYFRAQGSVIATLSVCFDSGGNRVGIRWEDEKVESSTKSLAEGEKRIREILTLYRDVPIAITGHSYGGHLALRLAQPTNAAYQVRFLATLDPISFVECRPRDVLLGSAGCTSFPPDVSETEQNTIAGQVGFWRNLYQTTYKKLHSGPGFGATNAIYEPGRRNTHDDLARDAANVQLVTEDLMAHW